MWVQGRASVLEHPAPAASSEFPDAPSIWHLPLLRLLCELPNNEAHSIFQGLFGALSPKPTWLMCANGPCLAKCLVPHQTRSTLPPALKMGRQGNTYSTFALKEYPQALCSGLADAFHQAWCATPSSPTPNSLDPFPHEMRQLFMSMVASEIGTGQIGPDFAF